MIFYVDDCEADVFMMELALQRQGLSLLSADSVSAARQKFDTEKVSLIVIDWNLNDGSAVDVAKYVRKISQSFPLVFLSGLLDDDKIQLASTFSPLLIAEKDIDLNYIDAIVRIADKLSVPNVQH